MLQLVDINKKMKDKRFGAVRKLSYRYNNACITLEQEDIRVLTAGNGIDSVIWESMNNDSVAFIDNTGIVAISAAPIIAVSNYETRMRELEDEVNRLRSTINVLQNGNNQNTEG